MKNNIMLLTDSYKVSHYKQYPPGTEVVYSYFESRGGKFDKTAFFGLQYYLKEYLSGKVVTKEKIDEAEEYCKGHFGGEMFNREGWEYILNEHDGKLPVKIKAVPEGTLVPTSNVLMTIENTDPKCFWLTNYLETLLVQVWYGSTVATISHEMRKLILSYLEKTGDPEGIGFKLHDFGFRGVSSVESAGVGGAAHLLNFLGTDTMQSLVVAKDYYNADMAGFSIPASEHSTITSWGAENENKAMENMLIQYPAGLVACVSDSFNIYNAAQNIWGGELKDKVLERDGTLVVRPDSGHPPFVLRKLIHILGEKFGYTINSKGYKVLDPHVRIIQGDGCGYEMCKTILSALEEDEWSTDNIAFGMGGGLLQKLNRDTFTFAFKCAAIKVNGEWRDVFKSPVEDAWKASKKGRMKLVIGSDGLTTVGINDSRKDELVEVFKDGEVKMEWMFDGCRERIQ